MRQHQVGSSQARLMKREARRLVGRFLPVRQPAIGSPVDDKITKVDRQTLERRLVVALLIVDD
jgi:hypothetical protein